MNSPTTMYTKVPKLLIIIHMIQLYFSTKIRSYFPNSNNTSILTVSSYYDCGKQTNPYNPFQAVNDIIDHLIADHKSNNGKLTKKPSTIIIKLNLFNSKGLNLCYISK